MPTVRTIHLADLVSLISFLRKGSHREVTARFRPEVWRDSGALATWGLVSRLVTRSGGLQVWAWLGNGGIQGLAIARPRAGRLAWDVEDLFVPEGNRAVGVDLLDHLSGEASRRGARRIFISTPVDDGLTRIARQAGFVNYASEALHSARFSGDVGGSRLRPSRPRLRQDTQALFQLYSAAVPCRVRSAEAMTIDEWLSLSRGSRLWAPTVGGSHRHFVWDNDGELVAWLQLTVGRRSQHLELLMHPAHRASTEDLVLSSLSRTCPRLPIYVSTRDYQPEVASALDRQGFNRVAECLVFARQLAARAPNRALVPARA